MYCPICNEALSKVAVPSYLGNVYHCDNCGQDFWYRMTKLFCPRCWKTIEVGYRLITKDENPLKQTLCPDCFAEVGWRIKND